MTAAQRKPESTRQAAEWSARVRRFEALGVGGANCLTGVCGVQASYSTGEGYGPPHPPCSPCADRMATWGTRRVGGTGYYRLPSRRLPGPLTTAQQVPGVCAPAGAVPGLVAA